MRGYWALVIGVGFLASSASGGEAFTLYSDAWLTARVRSEQARMELKNNPEEEAALRLVFETIQNTVRMMREWSEDSAPYVGGDRLEVYLFEPLRRGDVLNAYCDQDRTDFDRDGNQSEPILKFEWDPHFLDSSGRKFAAHRDLDIVSHETAHAVFWGMMGVRPDDSKRFGRLTAEQWRELIAIDEATGDVAAMLLALGAEDRMQKVDAEVQGDWLRSSELTRQTEYATDFIRGKINTRYSLNQPTFRNQALRFLVFRQASEERIHWVERIGEQLEALAAEKKTEVSKAQLLEYFQGVLSEWKKTVRTPYAAGSLPVLENLFYAVQANWSRMGAPWNDLGDVLSSHEELLTQVVDQAADQLNREEPKVLEGLAAELLEQQLQQEMARFEDFGLARDFAKPAKVSELHFESHVLSLVISRATYRVLAQTLMKQKNEERLPLKDALRISREKVGKTYFRALRLFAKETPQGVHSLKDFAQFVLQESALEGSEWTLLWRNAFEEVEIL